MNKLTNSFLYHSSNVNTQTIETSERERWVSLGRVTNCERCSARGKYYLLFFRMKEHEKKKLSSSGPIQMNGQRLMESVPIDFPGQVNKYYGSEKT